MRIAMSAIGMESARSHMTAKFSCLRYEEKELDSASAKSLFGQQLFGNETLKEESSEKKELSEKKDPDKKSGTGNMMTMSEIFNLRQKVESTRKTYSVRKEEDIDAETIRNKSVLWILELLFGRRYGNYKDSLYSNDSAEAQTALETETAVSAGASQAPVKVYEYTALDCYTEEENTSFSAEGKVVCGDGREISFNINVSMSRRFVAETGVSLGTGFVRTCDPLVISLDGNPAGVSDQTFRFDIEGDGETDTIGRLRSGCGYLALDKNEDGVINDGKELFGTSSGDGFKDLAEYDSDGNGWIDEDDEIWQKLKIWVMDEKGESKLYSLAESGVGALYLKNVETQFSDTDDLNSAKSFIRSSGLFLYENGMTGMLQHLDLVKFEKDA
ncbi:MAG: hypothetical protein II741_06800 [Lachnospiraceae bacterium]|nr:hypothetical protein [Lachnospiraceae bacterium]